jgi:hypothetical protein
LAPIYILPPSRIVRNNLVEMLASEELPMGAFPLLGRIAFKERGGVGNLAARQAVAGSHVRLCREIVGNPFRPSAFGQVWRSAEVCSLARAAYEERISALGHLYPARLAVLSDALEEDGCTDGDVLSHLRSPGPHVRGCWALDLVLGKGVSRDGGRMVQIL